MDTRTKILNAASGLFLDGGATALSVRAIAMRAGLSTIGIYSHFKGKQGILDALYIEGFDLVYRAMDVEIGEQTGAQNAMPKIVTLQDVLQGCKNYLRVAVENEAHYRLIFGESDSTYQPSDEAREAADRAFGKLVNNTGAFLQDNHLKSDRIQVSMDIWAMMHGYVSIRHHARAKDDWEWESMAMRAVESHLRATK